MRLGGDRVGEAGGPGFMMNRLWGRGRNMSTGGQLL